MFAQHRTYHLREHWISKGLAAVSRAETEARTENMFLRPDAPEHLGIGPAMVQALRFWLLACGLTYERGGAGRAVHFTEMGRLLWRCDPYLEQLESIWLLHSQLASNRLQAPTWFWFFSSYASSRLFDEATCLEALHSWVIASYPEHIIQRTTLHKDLLCLVRMYDGGRQATSPEDGTASPLARLRLLASTRQGPVRRYRLLPPDPAHLSPLILLFVLTVQQRQRRANTCLVSLTDALCEPGNVGRIFPLLTRNVLLDVLAQLPECEPAWGVGLTRHAGQEYLCLPACSPDQILRRCYQKDTIL